MGLAHFETADLPEAEDHLRMAREAAPAPDPEVLALLAATQALLGATADGDASDALAAFVDAQMDRPRRVWRLSGSLGGNPRSMTWHRPTLAETVAGFPFARSASLDRLAEGLSRAGIAGHSLGYYRLTAEDRLSANEIRALVFGAELADAGGPSLFAGWWQIRTEDGEVVQGSDLGPTALGREARSVLLGDTLCDVWTYEAIEIHGCALVFSPEAVGALPGSHALASEFGLFPFEVRR